MRNISQFIIASLVGTAATVSVSYAQDQTITVAWYGGNWGDAFQACVATPFTDKNGIKVNVEIGTSTTTLAKLQQQASAPTIDVAYMDGGISELAQEAGVLGDIDLGAMPNGSNLSSAAAYSADDKVFAVSSGYYALGVTYNTSKVKEAPTSWDALWDEAYAGAVALPSPANSAGIPFVIFLSNILNDKSPDLGATFEKLSQLDVAMFWDSSGAGSNAFQSGEVEIGAHFNVVAWDLADKGLPVGFAVPKEGLWATDARLHIVKNAPHADAAAKFIDQALSSESAACLAEKLYLGPAVKNVELSQEVKRKLPWGENGSVDDLKILDWRDVNARRSELTESWNRKVVR